MPPKLRQNTLTTQVSNRGQTYDVDVDPFDVNRLYDLVMASISGQRLHQWLRFDVHRYFRQQISVRFGSGGDSKSGKWAPLADATQDIRAALGVPPAQPINIRSALKGNRNSLFDFVTEHYDSRAGDDWAELDVPGKPPDAMVAKKLRTAQQGSPSSENSLGYGDTPARPVLAHDQSDMQTLLEMLQGHIMLDVAGALV